MNRYLAASIALLTIGGVIAPQLNKLRTGEVTTLPQSLEQSYEQQLQTAQQEASRDLSLALERIAGIPRNSQHFGQSQRLQENWSKDLLGQAISRYRQGDVQGAQAAIAAIPNINSIAPELQARRQQWANEMKLLDQVASAQSTQDWDSALNALDALRGSELYNTPKVQGLIAQTLDLAANPTFTVAAADMPTTSATVTPVTFTTEVNAPKLDITPPKPATLAVDVDAALEASSPIARSVNTRPAPLPRAAFATNTPAISVAATQAQTAETTSLPQPMQVAERPALAPDHTILSAALLTKPAQTSEVSPTVIEVSALEESLSTVNTNVVASIDYETPALDAVEIDTDVDRLEHVLSAETLSPTQITLESPLIKDVSLPASELQFQMVNNPDINITQEKQFTLEQSETEVQLNQQEQPVLLQI